MRENILRKIILSTVLTVAAVILPHVNVAAAEANGSEQVYYNSAIVDEALLLSNDEKDLLLEQMKELIPYGNVIFASEYLESGQDYEGYTENLYYSMFGNEPGVILNIDMGNRKITLSASTQMEEYLKSERDSIVDNIYEFASDEDYYGCASECFTEVRMVIEDEAIAHTMKHIDNAIIALILALILNFLIVFVTVKKKVSVKKVVGALAVTSAFVGADVALRASSKRYSPKSSGSGGSGGGGGGGGGFSGGSSSHGF